MISSQINVRKYRTNGHEQVYGIHAEVLGRLKKQKEQYANQIVLIAL